jgi:hypothetical protein
MKLLLVISYLAFCVADVALAQATSSDAPPSAREAYRYTSVPGARWDDQAKETIFMTYDAANDPVRFASRTLGKDSLQTIAITTTPQGAVVSATLENKTFPSGEITQRSSIRKERGKVYVDSIQGQKSSTRSIRVPEGQEFAVDASLLYLMRQFPFDTGKEWRVFMVDFSGQSVTVSISNKDTELVTVPAGAFLCYRMEVLISVAFLKTTITYWLTQSPPHFLVQHKGKKGPFTKTYTTVLDSIEALTTDHQQ